MNDDYEGNFDTRRALIYTLSFTAKVYLFGPITDVTSQIVKKVTVGYLSGSGPKDPKATRDVTYQTTPRATKDYNGDIVTLLSKNLNMIDTLVEVDDGSTITEKTYIYVGQEEMYVESVTGNTLVVRRAQDNTQASNHVLGAQVSAITEADNNLIQFGDNFGFDGDIF